MLFPLLSCSLSPYSIVKFVDCTQCAEEKRPGKALIKKDMKLKRMIGETGSVENFGSQKAVTE